MASVTDVPGPVQRQPKPRKKPALRKLIAPEKTNKSELRRPSCVQYLFRKSTFVLVTVGLCSAGLLIMFGSSKALQRELAEHYHQTYKRLSRESDNLCAESNGADYGALMQALERTVVGQDRARQAMGDWFQTAQNAPYRCMVLHGGTGVGKSLSARVIAAHYPWPDKVFYVAGSEHRSERKRYAAFKATLFQIQQSSFLRSRCTNYLLVVDHLRVDETAMVGKMSHRLRSLSGKNHLLLRALFVFQGTTAPRRLATDAIRKEVPEATVIEFGGLSACDLEQCIRREGASFGIDLGNDDSLVRTVAGLIDVSRHGCKPVRAKLSLFA